MSLTILARAERLQHLPSEQARHDGFAAGLEFEGGFSLDRTVGLGAPQIRAVRVDDDSLLGFGIYPGDRLIVDRSATPAVEQYVVVPLDGEDTYGVRLLAPDPKGGLLLKAARPSMASIPLNGRDSMQIWGVVLWVVSYVGRG
ncbi:LexA family protein [Pseudomonas sp. NPDC089530]|uniref:LexA family protein n=1 Tax=Pseudomonas sp. NPDC089530 TaxID=3390651 RepID=UPI003CFCF254